MTNVNDKQRKVLGKGLSSLLPARGLPSRGAAASPVPATETTASSKSLGAMLAIEAIEANPAQPRTAFQPERLEELAESIRVNGVIQPLVVRRAGSGYQIIAGERRWRAARMAGLREVPAVIQDIADRQLLEIALIENIQREDLTPIETALAYERLVQEMGLSQEEIGRRTGKDRASIANTIRLLKLPTPVQHLLSDRRLSMGHARAILGLSSVDEQIQLAEKASAQGLSVRQVEALVQQMTSERPGKNSKREVQQDPNVRAAADELARVLGTRVRIVELNEQRGRIEIEYYSEAELDRIYQEIVS